MAKKQKIVTISDQPEKQRRNIPNYPFQNRGGLCIWDSSEIETFLGLKNRV